MDDTTVRCAECNAAVMELDWNPDSWAASEIDYLNDEIVDLNMKLDMAELDRNHADQKSYQLQVNMADYKRKVHADGQSQNNELAMKCVTYSNIIDTLKHIIKYGRKPSADDTIKLNLLLKEGGYPPL